MQTCMDHSGHSEILDSHSKRIYQIEKGLSEHVKEHRMNMNMLIVTLVGSVISALASGAIALLTIF